MDLEELETELGVATRRLAEIAAFKYKTLDACMAAAKAYHDVRGDPVKLKEVNEVHRSLTREMDQAHAEDLALLFKRSEIEKRIQAIHMAEKQGA